MHLFMLVFGTWAFVMNEVQIIASRAEHLVQVSTLRGCIRQKGVWRSVDCCWNSHVLAAIWRHQTWCRISKQSNAHCQLPYVQAVLRFLQSSKNATSATIAIPAAAAPISDDEGNAPSPDTVTTIVSVASFPDASSTLRVIV